MENNRAHSRLLADMYNNLGCLYENTEKKELAKEYFLKAIMVLESIAEDNEDEIIPLLASCYYDIAIMCDEEEYFDEALRLANKYPEDEVCGEIIDELQC